MGSQALRFSLPGTFCQGGCILYYEKCISENSIREGRVEDSQIIGRAKAGDIEAFRILVEEYAGIVERTARVLVFDRSDAEDAAQEAWLDAWKGLPRFQVERAFRPWLLAIVANRCRMRARQRQPVTMPYSDEIGETLTAPDAEDHYDEELHRALEGLDSDQRQVLALRFYADLQLEEIAELMQTPLGTVKSRLHRAIATLRGQIMQKQDESGVKGKGVPEWIL
jgi:RNA polymerase sigma-70 factor, ECF subfamily